MKKTFAKLLFTVLAVGLVSNAWAAGGREKLNEFFTQVDTMQAAFTQQVVDDKANRRALYDRFEISQSVYRTDPWAEHAAPDERAKWAPLADLTLEAAE